MARESVIRGPLTILGTLPSGTGDNILTIDVISGAVGSIVASSLYTAGNGLTLSGSQFKLGGILTELTTTIDYTGNTLTFRGGDGLGGGGAFVITNVEAGETVSFGVTGAAGAGGLKYAADYSVAYTTRSLVDKAYVDSRTGGITNSALVNQLAISDGTNLIGYTDLIYTAGLLQVPGQVIFTADDATTGNVTTVLALRHTTSGVPANGIGVGLSFSAETSAGNVETGGTILVSATEVAAGVEDFDMVFTAMRNGAVAAERLRLGSDNITLTAHSTAGYIDLQAPGQNIRATSGTTNVLDVTTATTSTVVNVLSLRRTSSGVPATGIGSGLVFEVETAASNNESGVILEAVSTDVVPLSEDFDFVIKTMDGGSAATQRMRINSVRTAISNKLLVGSSVAPHGTVSCAVVGTSGAGEAIGQQLINLTTSGATWFGLNEVEGTATGSFYIQKYGSTHATLAGQVDFYNVGNASMTFATNNVERLVITGDGRFYGKALHNNAGSVTGTTNQYIASGTYTPTLTAVTNVASSIPSACQYVRVGNVVTFSGSITVAATSGGSFIEIRLSLPIGSNFSAQSQCGGTAFNGSNSAYLRADTTTDEAHMIGTPTGTASLVYFFSATYVIV